MRPNVSTFDLAICCLMFALFYICIFLLVRALVSVSSLTCFDPDIQYNIQKMCNSAPLPYNSENTERRKIPSMEGKELKWTNLSPFANVFAKARLLNI